MDNYEKYDALCELAEKLYKNEFDLLARLDWSDSDENTIYCDFIIDTNPQGDAFTDEQFIEFKDFVNKKQIVKDDYEIFAMQDVKDTGVFTVVELKEPSVDLTEVANNLETFAEEVWDKYIEIRERKTESKKKINKKEKTVLNKKPIKENKAENDANELYWKAQDIALEGCQDIITKLQEYHRDGFVEDFYNLFYRVVASIEHNNIDPRKLINEIQDDANAFAEETDEDDKNWLKSCIESDTHSLEIFNKIINNRIINIER